MGLRLFFYLHTSGRVNADNAQNFLLNNKWKWNALDQEEKEVVKCRGGRESVELNIAFLRIKVPTFSVKFSSRLNLENYHLGVLNVEEVIKLKSINEDEKKN